MTIAVALAGAGCDRAAAPAKDSGVHWDAGPTTSVFTANASDALANPRGGDARGKDAGDEAPFPDAEPASSEESAAEGEEDDDCNEEEQSELHSCRRWTEDCGFNPKGKGSLVRTSRSETGANSSAGTEEYELLDGKRAIFAWTYDGPVESGAGNEAESWNVECSPGRVTISGGADATVPLIYRGGRMWIDPAFNNEIHPGTARFSDQTLAELATILGAMAKIRVDSPPAPDAGAPPPADLSFTEADERVRLLRAERAFRAGSTDDAVSLLDHWETVKAYWPVLGRWATALARPIAADQRAVPLHVENPRRAGLVFRPPAAPQEDDAPGWFWRKQELCVRQEDTAAPPRMRCLDVPSWSWGPVEPYRSPFADGWKFKTEYGGHPRLYRTAVVVISPDGGETELGDFDAPLIVARGTEGRLTVVENEADDDSTLPELGDIVASGFGSAIAGGGKLYFSGPDRLVSGVVNHRSWSFTLGPKLRGRRCVAAPLVSPDQHRAACVLAPADADPGAPADAGVPRSELWVFDVVATGDRAFRDAGP